MKRNRKYSPNPTKRSIQGLVISYPSKARLEKYSNVDVTLDTIEEENSRPGKSGSNIKTQGLTQIQKLTQINLVS